MEDNKEVQRIIKLTLIRLGIKCDLVGFSYLVHAVEVAIEQPMLVYNLKKLFAIVAKKCNVENPFRVEANIQNAITLTFQTQKDFHQLMTYTAWKFLNQITSQQPQK